MSAGCAVDPIVMPDVRYSGGLTRAFTVAHGFKFSDISRLRLECLLEFCRKDQGQCIGFVPPRCPHSSPPTSPSRPSTTSCCDRCSGLWKRSVGEENRPTVELETVRVRLNHTLLPPSFTSTSRAGRVAEEGAEADWRAGLIPSAYTSSLYAIPLLGGIIALAVFAWCVSALDVS